MPDERTKKIRQVAILVASLDDVWVERVLSGLADHNRRAVLRVAEGLGSIDPAEQKEIVRQFRKSVADGIRDSASSPTLNQVEGVELDASLLARIESQFDDEVGDRSSAESSNLHPLSGADAETLAQVLVNEHPQTGAVMLSRLGNSQAAQVLAHMSTELQADLLVRLADLDTSDQQTLQVVDSQLATWMEQQRQRKQRQAAGMELVQRILADTPDTQRQTLLTQLNSRDSDLVYRLGAQQRSESHSVSPQPVRAVTKPADRDLRRAPPSTRFPTIMRRTPPKPITQTLRSQSDPMEEFDRADDSTLLAAFRHAEHEVVMLVLASANKSLLRRVLRGMPRRQAKQLRNQLRKVGPTRLSDLLAAQQSLLNTMGQIAPSHPTAA